MITLTREEAYQVLDCIVLSTEYKLGNPAYEQMEAFLCAKLSAPEPEPVAYLCENAVGHKYFRWKKPQSVFKPIALYTAPPQRKEWQGLTDEEIEVEVARVLTTLTQDVWPVALSRAIEAKLKEKNGGH
jgi:hypothetical protein